MVNIVSTTTPTANGPRAMTLQALKQRQEELAAQQTAVAKPHEVTSPWMGLGDIANAFFTARRGDYLQNQENQTRDTLAKLRAGWGAEGPTQAQAAEYSRYDPEYGNKISEDVMKAAQDKAAQDRLFGHEDTTLGKTQEFTAGQNTLNRQQELELEQKREAAAHQEGEANRGVTTAGQQITATQNVAQNELEKTRIANEAKYRDASLGLEERKTAWSEAHPDIQSVPQAKAALEEGKFGQPGTQDAQDLYDAVVTKLTTVPNTGTSVEVTIPGQNGAPDQRVAVDQNGGGRGGGSRSGGGGGKTGTGGPLSYPDYASPVKSAVDTKARNKAAREAIKHVGEATPWIGGQAADIGNYVTSKIAGQDTANSLFGDPASRAVVNNANIDETLANTGSLPGTISNQDRAWLSQKGISLSDLPASNEAKLDISDRMADNVIRRKEMADQWLREGHTTLSGFEEQRWNPWMDAHPVLRFNAKTGQVEALPIPPSETGGGGGMVPPANPADQLFGAARTGQLTATPAMPPASSTPAPAAAVATPKTPEEFQALPSGTIYIDPDDGKKYRK